MAIRGIDAVLASFPVAHYISNEKISNLVNLVGKVTEEERRDYFLNLICLFFQVFEVLERVSYCGNRGYEFWRSVYSSLLFP